MAKQYCPKKHSPKVVKSLERQGIPGVPMAIDSSRGGERYCPVHDPRVTEWDVAFHALTGATIPTATKTVTIQDRGTIITTIAKVVMESKDSPISVRGCVEQSARRGWDEAFGGAQYDYRLGTACGSAYDQAYWAAKNLGELGRARVLEIIRA